MKFGAPWNLKGIRPDARETAKEAARRSGMSVDAWLNSVIIEQGAEAGVLPPRRISKDDDEGGRPARRLYADDDSELHWSPQVAHNGEDESSLAEINERLDGLTRQLERLTRYQTANATAQAAPRAPVAATHRVVDSINRLDVRLDQLISEGRTATDEIERRVSDIDRTLATLGREPPINVYGGNGPVPSVDQAMAEIAARQQALENNTGIVPAAAPAPPSLGASPFVEAPRLPATDFTGVERQLRNINHRIDSLSQPSGLENAISALRGDLAEIGNTLTEAMPRRAVEALEAEVRTLAGRIDASRQNGVDASALTGVERALAEVRDALHGLTPAENLAGLGDAVKGLSRKIDTISTTSQDPAALQQLEAAITGLRGIVSHVASNDALAKLSEEVRSIATKVDRLASAAPRGDMLSNLDKRIATIADALEARGEAGTAHSPELEAIVRSLADKIERIQLSRGEQTALGHLEDRIAKFVEKLDHSDARLGQLENIERGLADLLINLEVLRGANGSPAIRAAGPIPAEVNGLKREIDEIKQSEQRTHNTLEAVHGALDHVVDRLATIEAGLHSEPRPAGAQPQPVPPSQRIPPYPKAEPAAALQNAPRPAPPVPAPLPAAAAPNPAPVAIKMAPPPPRERRPIDPNLPPDQPIEPGATSVLARSSVPLNQPRHTPTPADRIAASQAALGQTRPPVIPDPGGKSDFIAAARRAAQAAAETAAREAPRTPTEAQGNAPVGLGKRIAKRVKLLILAASVVVIVLGALRVAMNLMETAGTTDPAPPTGSLQAPGERPQSNLGRSGPYSLPSAPARQTAALPNSERSSGVLPPAESQQVTVPTSGLIVPEAITPRAPTPPPAPRGGNDPSDITGAIAPVGERTIIRSPTGAATTAPAQDVLPALPAGIGGPMLRAAAIKGDPAAAFEVGNRYAEGRNVGQDLMEAARWYELAAAAGLAPAQFRLAGLYEKATGVKKDLDAARRLYTSAADKGNGQAMHNLAVLYAEGIDGKPDYRTAARWFRAAADRGVSDSQYNLAILYARGIGVSQNLAEAYRWFAIAAQSDDKDSAAKRDEIAARLDRQSLTAARLAVQTWTAQPQPEGATTVRPPPGGWDRIGRVVTPPRSKSRATPQRDPT